MSEPEVITIRVKLTAEDYVDFNRYHGRMQLALLFLIYWAIFLIVSMWSGGHKGSLSLALMIPAGLVLSGLLIGLHFWTIRVKTRNLFKSDPFAQMEQQLEFSSEGIRHTTGATTMNLTWADVWKVAETSKAMIIYLARNKAIVLPKRDGGEWPQLKETLRRHLPPAKLRLKS
jgi:hypothetical protein